MQFKANPVLSCTIRQCHAPPANEAPSVKLHCCAARVPSARAGTLRVHRGSLTDNMAQPEQGRSPSPPGRAEWPLMMVVLPPSRPPVMASTLDTSASRIAGTAFSEGKIHLLIDTRQGGRCRC